MVEVGCRSRLRRRHVVMMLTASSLRALRRSRLIEVKLIIIVSQSRVDSITHNVILSDMLQLVFGCSCG